MNSGDDILSPPPCVQSGLKSMVFITDRGKPAFALLKIKDYYGLAGGQEETSPLSFMHGDDMPRTDGIAYEAPRIHIELKPASEDAGER